MPDTKTGPERSGPKNLSKSVFFVCLSRPRLFPKCQEHQGEVAVIFRCRLPERVVQEVRPGNDLFFYGTDIKTGFHLPDRISVDGNRLWFSSVSTTAPMPNRREKAELSSGKKESFSAMAAACEASRKAAASRAAQSLLTIIVTTAFTENDRRIDCLSISEDLYSISGTCLFRRTAGSLIRTCHFSFLHVERQFLHD